MTQDAFGHALLAHAEGRAGVAVVEREDGFIEADGSDYFAPMSNDDVLWSWMLPRIGQRVVDVGAGAGRASIHLQERGLHVTAVDVSPGAIEVCRRRGMSDTFLGAVSDLADAGGAAYDTFLCLGGNLGLIGRDRSAEMFFEALGRLGGPDVRLLGTMINPYVTDVAAHLAYHEANRAAGRPAGAVRLRIRYQAAATPWFELVWASPDELQETAKAFGWIVVDVEEAGPFYAAELRPE